MEQVVRFVFVVSNVAVTVYPSTSVSMQQRNGDGPLHTLFQPKREHCFPDSRTA